MLLAVIFSSENAPDIQTGFEPRISQNISAVFSRISDIWGSGTLPGKIVSDGEPVQVQEQVVERFFGGIPNPLNSAFPVFPLLQPMPQNRNHVTSTGSSRGLPGIYHLVKTTDPIGTG